MTIAERFRNIGRALTNKTVEPQVIIKENKQKTIDVLGGMLDLTPAKLSSEKGVSKKLLNANTGWVYRNNDAIAQEVSKMEFELYSLGLSNGEIAFNEIESHPLLDLLDKPNDETVKTDALYIIQSHKKLTGNAYWLKIRNNRQVVQLRSLPPDKITLNLRTPTGDDPTVIESYLYRDTIDGKRVEVTYNPADILHFKKPNPNNSFIGIGAVEALSTTIDLDNLAEETAKKFYENGAITNFVLSSPNKVTDDQLKRLKAELRASNSGVKNAFKAMILGGGLEPKDISYTNKEMEFIAQLEWYRDKIMAGFGNTKASLGMIDDVNRASHEGSIIEWQRNTVKPDMESIVNILNEFLVPEFGDNLVLGFCDPVPEDRADDITEVKDLYPLGLLTLDEARGMVDLDPTEGDGGDEYYSKPTPIIQDPNQGDPNAETN